MLKLNGVSFVNKKEYLRRYIIGYGWLGDRNYKIYCIKLYILYILFKFKKVLIFNWNIIIGNFIVKYLYL